MAKGFIVIKYKSWISKIYKIMIIAFIMISCNDAQKMISLNIALSFKILYFSIGKLSIIDINIISVLKLIFTFESYETLSIFKSSSWIWTLESPEVSILQNNLMNVKFKLSCIFFAYLLYFNRLFEDWSVVRLLYFLWILLKTLF